MIEIVTFRFIYLASKLSFFFQNKLRKSLKLSCLCVWLICLLINLAGCHWLTRCFVSFVFVHWLVWYIFVCMFLNGFVDQLPSLNTISFISFQRGLGRVRQGGRDGHCPFVKLTPRKGRSVTPSPPPTTTWKGQKMTFTYGLHGFFFLFRGGVVDLWWVYKTA